MQEFKDRKSKEWNLDYWIRLAQGQDGEAVEEEPAALVDKDKVVQSQEGDAPPVVVAVVTNVVNNQLVDTTSATEQPGAPIQGTE